MKDTDLMIGNIVFDTITKKEILVTKTSMGFIQKSIDLKMIEPVVLLDSHLAEFGLKINESGVKSFHGFEFTYYSNLGWLVWKNGVFITQMDYLHQLQNLIHFL